MVKIIVIPLSHSTLTVYKVDRAKKWNYAAELENWGLESWKGLYKISCVPKVKTTSALWVLSSHSWTTVFWSSFLVSILPFSVMILLVIGWEPPSWRRRKEGGHRKYKGAHALAPSLARSQTLMTSQALRHPSSYSTETQFFISVRKMAWRTPCWRVSSLLLPQSGETDVDLDESHV